MSNPVRVLAHGWYGAGNVGDELLLRVLTQWCEEASAQVSVLSVNPGHTRDVHGLEAVDASDYPSVARLMIDSDLFVLGGGGLFQTHYSFTVPTLYSYGPGDVASYARPALMARQMGVPSLMWAQGVGPLRGAQARAVVRDVYSGAEFASVRDAVSAELLREIGVDSEIVVAPDPVWALPVVDHGVIQGGKRRLGLVMRPWDAAPGWEDRFVESLRATVDADAFRLVWIPFQSGEAAGSTSDLPFLRGLAARLDGYEHEFLDLHALDSAAVAIASCERLVCMRLHAQILAFKLDRPILCVEYDPKMERASQHVAMPSTGRIKPASPQDTWNRSLAELMSGDDLKADQDRVAEAATGALAHRQVLHGAIVHARARAKRDWCDRDFDWMGTWSAAWLHSLIADRDDTIASLHEEIGQRDSSLAQIRDVVAQQQTELAGLEQSLEQAQAECLAQRPLRERVDALTQAIEESDRARISLCHELSRRSLAVENLTGRVALLRGEKQAAERAREAADIALAKTSNELQHVTTSLSWRITHPIRFARALVVLPMPERKQLVYSALRSAFWSLPKPLRDRFDQIRQKVGSRRARRSALAARSTSNAWVEMAASHAKIAIVPSAFEFDELANQRPINLAKYLAKKGYLVVFAAWQWSRQEQLTKSETMVFPGIWQVDLYSLIDHAAALGQRKDNESVFFLTLPAPELVELHQQLRRKGLAVVYDILDEWEAFNAVGQAPWFSAEHECEAVLAADAVTAVSPPLVAKFERLRSDMHVIGNGYTAATLGVDNKFCTSAVDRTAVQPCIGYFGHLTDAWFDWEIVLGAARQMPDFKFEIIGYGTPEWVDRAASELPNLVLVGKVPPSELSQYARHWHVGLAPFRPGPLAVAIDPIKVYEYMYLGLPTVCTGIPHLAQLPGVAVVEGLEAFVRACRDKARAPVDYDSLERCLVDTTWEARFDRMMNVLDTTDLRGLYVA
ncbi:polysaccharide pyruvyl transferase family protein [Luteibacter sp.]|uniref:polysaccharide pyruvyl transferase family protein n=1 Tax=Luteibacter sp. TaxID=1886636 RepID=UPI0028076367|nr:polysaccharide pyruvyl transferase family protein [Luteibacter sp.]MDQ8051002.1 polysaccharide pyruvyl transferase family protein [Luteibacter sp.]